MAPRIPRERLTRQSKAGTILRAKFRSGEPSGKEMPKAVHESDP